MPLVNYHGLEHSPVGLWQFNGSLTDSSGNGFTLTVESGTIRYSSLTPGVRGALLLSTSLIYNTFTSTLNIQGDLTLECLILLPSYVVGSRRTVCSHEANGETLGDNTAYEMRCLSAGGSVEYTHEHSTGVNPSYTLTGERPGLFVPTHFALTRTSNVIQFYRNGRAWGAPSSPLTGPEGGTNGRFRVGASNSVNAPECVLASLKVIASSLTAAQIAGEYNRTLGGLLGPYAP